MYWIGARVGIGRPWEARLDSKWFAACRTRVESRAVAHHGRLGAVEDGYLECHWEVA